ncbi:hypothetical protein CSB37_02130 [bacterium DOLZORAL124_38_8]|nr:MAG: hypothetical protein CSB37_02130 [bacterium DOLZORAL124_38_8]
MKQKGFTLVEVLTAMTLLTIFVGFIFQFSQSIQLGEKRLRIAKEFQRESRFLLDKLISVTQNNVVDYDRYFIEVGPSNTQCPKFDRLQLPKLINANPCSSTYTENNACENNSTNRAKLNYPEVFYWDTNDDNVPDRQLGGVKNDGTSDPCTVAFHKNSLEELYLINNTRTRRFAFKRTKSSDTCEPDNENCAHIQAKVEIGADTNHDGEADIWSTSPQWKNNQCKISNNGINYPILDLDIDTKSKCLVMAHDWQAISLDSVNIQSLNFKITPKKDPYLAFRDDSAQQHPKVTIQLSTAIKNPEKYSFEVDNAPHLHLQTTVSSRVYGNSRETNS